MRIRNAFTMIELIFVIVVMGIIGKFGIEFLAQAYRGFIFSNVNSALQSKSTIAVEFIASRLQYRIKDSVIARVGTVGAPTAIGSASGNAFTVLEWVSSDIDGYRATTTPNWSGIIDLDASTANLLDSPATDTTATDNLISLLSYGGSGVDDSALYFIGSNSDISTGYGWNGAVDTQLATMHPIKSTGDVTKFQPRVGSTGATNNFTNVDVYEYYKLAWTANAIVYTPGPNSLGTLTFYYDYQPWNGETLANAKNAVIMNGISTFQFMAIGSIMKIQVCSRTNLVTEETYSICKEKTIF